MASRLALRAARQIFAGSKAAVTRLPSPASGVVGGSRALSQSGDNEDQLKSAFVKHQSQFRLYLSEFGKLKLPFDTSDGNAVSEYVESVKAIRAKVGVPSPSEKLASLLESAAEDSETVREYLEKAEKLQRDLGIEDYEGSSPMLMEALDELEKKLGKPVALGDAKAMQSWNEASDAVYAKVGLADANIEELEKQADLETAMIQLAGMKGDAEEKMSTYQRRDGLEFIKVNLKELNPQPYL